MKRKMPLKAASMAMLGILAVAGAACEAGSDTGGAPGQELPATGTGGTGTGGGLGTGTGAGLGTGTGS